jgi:hypothetical protein
MMMTKRNWYLVAEGEAYLLDHDQAVVLQDAPEDDDAADELYHRITGSQRYSTNEWVVTLAADEDQALVLAILYDYDEASLDNVACLGCGETHTTLYTTAQDEIVDQVAAELIVTADHVAEAKGDCNCDFCRGGLNTIRQIVGFFPPGWWHETPEQRNLAMGIARRAVGEHDD